MFLRNWNRPPLSQRQPNVSEYSGYAQTCVFDFAVVILPLHFDYNEHVSTAVLQMHLQNN